MHRHLQIACALIYLVAPAGLSAEAGPKATDVPIALHGLDPVALATGQEEKGDNTLSAAHGRFRYLFSNRDHLAAFERQPDRYAFQGDGMCAVMPNVPASPDLFLAHDGKLYGFGSPACLARFKADPAAFLRPRLNVAIFVHDGVELLDFAGPGEVFTCAGRAFDVYTVSASPSPITSQGFVSVTPRYTFADCPPPDILVIPGGATQIPASDPTVIDWIRTTSKGADVVLSVCTGALLLAQAGLLDGLEATTHHSSLARLQAAAPSTRVHADRRFVDNGKVITSAGVSAGIDASLHVVDRLLGASVAAEAARRMEYDWESEAPAAPN